MAITDPDGYQTSLSMAMGRAHAREMDTELVGRFDDFTNTFGTSGSALTVAYLAASMAILDGNDAPRMARNAVVHPYSYYDLFSQMADAGSTPINSTPIDAVNDAMEEYYQGKLVGLRLFTNNHIGTGVAAKHGVFSRDAIMLDERVPYSIAYEAKPEIDGTQFHAVQYYGSSVDRQESGVELTADASVPS